MSRLEAKTTAGAAVPAPISLPGGASGDSPSSSCPTFRRASIALYAGGASARPRVLQPTPAREDRLEWGSRRTAAVRPATSSCTGPARLRTTRRDSRRNWRLPLPSANAEMLMPPPVAARESRHASFSGVPMAMRSYSTGEPRVVDPSGPIHSSWQPATRAPTTRPSSTTPQASAGDSGICEIDGSLGRDSVAPGQPVAAPASASADPLGQADDRDFADLAHIGRAVGG